MVEHWAKCLLASIRYFFQFLSHTYRWMTKRYIISHRFKIDMCENKTVSRTKLSILISNIKRIKPYFYYTHTQTHAHTLTNAGNKFWKEKKIFRQKIAIVDVMIWFQIPMEKYTVAFSDDPHMYYIFVWPTDHYEMYDYISVRFWCANEWKYYNCVVVELDFYWLHTPQRLFSFYYLFAFVHVVLYFHSYFCPIYLNNLRLFSCFFFVYYLPYSLCALPPFFIYLYFIS